MLWYVLNGNIIAALTEEARYQCMAHRLNTILNDAWKATTREHKQFAVFDDAVLSVVAYITRSSGIQERLPKATKKPSGTRPWRSIFLVPDSILTSSASLRDILAKRGEEHILLRITFSLLKEVVYVLEI